MRTFAMTLGLLVILVISSPAQPSIPRDDRIRLAEAFRIAAQAGNSFWPGWAEAPFAVLLVTPETEFLIRHPRPSPDFTASGYDSLLQSDVYYRPRVFAPNLLATFPAVGHVATIVIGQADQTEVRHSTRWVLTVLHEHFHQLQNIQPDYYRDVDQLNLSHGDQTGMWMLNFAFPYDSLQVDGHFSLLSRKLLEAVNLEGAPEFTVRFHHYLELRRQLQEMLSEEDYRYFSFQLWQEGIARYTEIRIGEWAAAHYTPTAEFQSLPDFVRFADDVRIFKASSLNQLRRISLKKLQRVAFYPFGAAEGFLLDIANPQWKDRYLRDKFSLDPLFGMQSQKGRKE